MNKATYFQREATFWLPWQLLSDYSLESTIQSLCKSNLFSVYYIFSLTQSYFIMVPRNLRAHINDFWTEEYAIPLATHYTFTSVTHTHTHTHTHKQIITIHWTNTNKSHFAQQNVKINLASIHESMVLCSPSTLHLCLKQYNYTPIHSSSSHTNQFKRYTNHKCYISRMKSQLLQLTWHNLWFQTTQETICFRK